MNEWMSNMLVGWTTLFFSTHHTYLVPNSNSKLLLRIRALLCHIKPIYFPGHLDQISVAISMK